MLRTTDLPGPRAGSWRIRCVGSPDQICGEGGADDTGPVARLAWSCGAALWWGVIRPDPQGTPAGEIRRLALPDPPEALTGGPGWIGALLPGSALRVDRRSGEIASEIERLHPWAEAWLGRDLLVEAGPEGNLARRVWDGRALPLPEGARLSPLIRPWAAGVGAVWAERGRILRTAGPPGDLPDPRWLVAGAGGAFAAGNDRATLVAPANSPPIHLPRPWRGAALTTAAAAHLHGDGPALDHLYLPLIPLPAPLPDPLPDPCPAEPGDPARLIGPGLWLSGGALYLTGAGGSAARLDLGMRGLPACLDAAGGLAGPGGRIWSLEDRAAGARLSGLPFWLAGAWWEVTGAGFGPVGGPYLPHGLDRVGDRPAAVTVEGGALLLQSLDGELQAWRMDGSLIGRRRHPWQPPPVRRDRDLPIPVAGRAGDLRWTPDGMLVEPIQAILTG